MTKIRLKPLTLDKIKKHFTVLEISTKLHQVTPPPPVFLCANTQTSKPRLERVADRMETSNFAININRGIQPQRAALGCSPHSSLGTEQDMLLRRLSCERANNNSQRVISDISLSRLPCERANNNYQRVISDISLSRLPCGRANNNSQRVISDISLSRLPCERANNNSQWVISDTLPSRSPYGLSHKNAHLPLGRHSLSTVFFFFFLSESFCVLLFPCWWRNSWRVRELPRVAERTVWVWQLTRVILRWFFFLYFQLLFTLFTVRPRALSLAEHTVKGLYLLRTV